ncbi:MAG: CTP synthase [Gemmataceae bacterium]|nr:CTP synthase [Gemmataceae bacterium]
MSKHICKHIFVTGGVVSSLGKGLTSASVGLLLEKRGLRVRLQKLDPYLNIDPGTMSPYQHGEVYVLDDGTETDLDLGHYERFTSGPLTRQSNYTSGRIYQSILQKERRGEYLGSTVQVIPHVTDEIKAAIRGVATSDVDVVITELGGTVGDIEGLPYLEAIRQFALDVGKNNCLYIHLTLVPYLKAAGEAKTKPTQTSVMQLRQIGIQPDVLICRTEREMSEGMKDKIALFCNVERRAVIEERDKELSIYEVPVSLSANKLDQIIVEKLALEAKPLDMSEWQGMLNRVLNPRQEVSIGVVGKYISLSDAYKSIYESLDHAGIALETRVVVRRIDSEEVERDGAERTLGGLDGILVPGGFGYRGIPGKLAAVRYAREKKIPFFGICLGLQCAVIEFARNALGLKDANTTEIDADTKDPVVCLLDEQFSITDLGGTMRLGSYPCKLTPGSLARKVYGADEVRERHRHRYEFNNAYRQRFEQAGMRFSGTSPDGNLVEVFEIPDHPWFLAVQSHPEFQSKPTKAHPLFREFTRASIEQKNRKRN